MIKAPFYVKTLFNLLFFSLFEYRNWIENYPFLAFEISSYIYPLKGKF